jgi:acyl-CoA dehydrogenase
VNPVSSTVDEADAIRERTRDRWASFLRDTVNPGTLERDRSATPYSPELVHEMFDCGLLTYGLPRELGGEAPDYFDIGVTLQELGYLSNDVGVCYVISVFTHVATEIFLSERADLIDRYARPMSRGQRFGAFGYTDTSDAFSFKTTCRQLPDGRFVITGLKPILTGALIADTFLVYVRNEADDLVVFILERDDPGVVIEPNDMAGLRGMGLGRLLLKDVTVGPERLLVASDGLGYGQSFLNVRRGIAACAPLGRMQGILEEVARHLNETVRYGQPLSQFPNVQEELGQMYVSVESSRAIVYRALDRVRDGRGDAEFDPVVSAAKYHVGEESIKVALSALRLMGGEGYQRERGFERYLRDFAGLLAGAGTQEILAFDLGVAVASGVSQEDERRASS